jgi:hypothetical protein
MPMLLHKMSLLDINEPNAGISFHTSRASSAIATAKITMLTVVISKPFLIITPLKIISLIFSYPQNRIKLLQVGRAKAMKETGELC